MVNLHEKFTDPHSREVLRSLDYRIDDATSHHPLLKQLHAGETTLNQFMYFAKVRLDAATNFVPFLSAIQERIQATEGWGGMAVALRENLDEELGFVHGEYREESDHERWRQDFRSGLQIFSREHWKKVRHFDSINVHETKARIYKDYGKKLKKISQEKNAPYLAGAFTVLEGILEQEFSAMHAYIRKNLRELTSHYALYVSHHAGHEHRHFDEVAEPLLRKCAASPHIVPEVIKGIEKMTQWRLEGVLGNIDIGLRLGKAKETPTLGVSSD